MPFPAYMISNWKQHRLENGCCLTCGKAFPEANGAPIIYDKKDGSVFLGTPNTNITVCGE